MPGPSRKALQQMLNDNTVIVYAGQAELSLLRISRAQI
jgi:hypothetical protein